MAVDTQKANFWKRIAAWLLDSMLLLILASGCFLGLSALTGLDKYNAELNRRLEDYEKRFSISMDITEEEFEKLEPVMQIIYIEADKVIRSDQELNRVYAMIMNLTLTCVSLGVLLAVLILEFAIPLFLKNGQTLGKKCFSLGVMRTDAVRLGPVQLFIRSVLGKYAAEIMVPVYCLLMVYYGAMGVSGLIIIGAVLIAQVLMLCITSTNSALHDWVALTIVVELSSQRVFESTSELIEYTKRIHAEEAERYRY